MLKRLFLIISILNIPYASCKNDVDTRDVEKKQKITSCNIAVIYELQYAKDTITSNRYIDRQVLEISAQVSKFSSVFADRTDSVMYQSRHSNSQSINPTYWLKNYEDGRYQEWYFNYPTQGQVTNVERIVDRDYYYQESLPSIDWKIESSTKLILGYQCQKASAFFCGRQWIVWFTIKIPLKMGPWKLHGLPGLILQAYDANNLFCYTAIGVADTSQRNIYWYAGGIKIKRMEMLRLQSLLYKDPAGIRLSHGKNANWVKDGKVVALKSGDFQLPYIPPLELE